MAEHICFIIIPVELQHLCFINALVFSITKLHKALSSNLHFSSKQALGVIKAHNRQ